MQKFHIIFMTILAFAVCADSAKAGTLCNCNNNDRRNDPCNVTSYDPAYREVGGSAYAGVGGPCYAGPGGSRYAGPGGPYYSGVGGPCYAGPGGPCYADFYGISDECPDICR